MDDNNPAIEVTIKKLKTRFCASSTFFPSCNGYGKTEEEAFQKLIKSISRFVAKTTEESIKATFDNRHYTEVILSTDFPRNEYTKSFPINPSLFQLQHAILLKMKSKSIAHMVGMEALPGVELKRDIQTFFEDMEQDISQGVAKHRYDKHVSSGSIQSITDRIVEEISNAQGDTFVVGFPLSLN